MVLLELDRPALRPLPATPYEFAEWRQAKVPFDYHVTVEHNFYSVPFRLLGTLVGVRLTVRTVEILQQGRRVASHGRLYGRGRYATDPGHRPAAHQRYLDWTPERVIRWAADVGLHTAQLVKTRHDPERVVASRLSAHVPHQPGPIGTGLARLLALLQPGAIA